MVCISTVWGDPDGLVCPNVQTVPPSAGYLKTGMPDHPQITKGPMLLVGPRLRRGSFTPATLRGPAPNGHPCPDGALAASMPLGPLRIACVQPAPKSRFVVSRLLRHEDQEPQSAALLMVPTLRVVTHSMTLCVIWDVAHAARLRHSQETGSHHWFKTHRISHNRSSIALKFLQRLLRQGNTLSRAIIVMPRQC
jgi:hypothetical protein